MFIIHIFSLNKSKFIKEKKILFIHILIITKIYNRNKNYYIKIRLII